MFAWIVRLFGGTPAGGTIEHNADVIVPVPEPNNPPSPQVAQMPEPPAGADPERAGFLLSLLSTDALPDLNGLPLLDREFIAATIRRLNRNEFEIPLLPDAAIRIQRLISTPDANLDELADVFKNDPTLSAELLRLANSTYLAYRYPTLDLHQAIVRVGFNQLKGLVMVFSLRSRILRVRQYQREVSWVTDLSLAMAKCCQVLATELMMPPEEAFTLGLMHHIEYLAILGEAVRFTAEHRGQAVSRSAIAESVRRVGTRLHAQIARSWGIGNFERYYHEAAGDADSGDDVTDVPHRLDQLQRIVIVAMSGGTPDYTADGLDGERLKGCVESVVNSPPDDG